MRTGILGDSTSLEWLLGVTTQPQVLLEDGHINWVETAAMGEGHRHGVVSTSTLLDTNKDLLRMASGAAATTEDHLDLDLIVFSFAAANRCSMEDDSFKAAFQWADAYFRARNKPAHVGVLLVDHAVNKPPGPAQEDDKTIGLVAGNHHLEALMRARRIVRWNATTPALAYRDYDHEGVLPDISDDLARVLADFCRRPVVPLSTSGSSHRGGSGGARAGGHQFIKGLFVCLLVVLVALLVLHLSPSLQARAASALLPESAAELARLQLENGNREALTVRLQKDNELLKEINARQKKQNDELTKDLTDLKHRNTDLQAQVDRLTTDQLAANRALADRTLVVSSLCQGCCQGETAVGGSMCRLCSSAPAA